MRFIALFFFCGQSFWFDVCDCFVLISLMKSMKRLLFTLFAAVLLPMFAFAKSDPVLVSKIDFKKLPQIGGSSGQWTRIEVQLDGKENPNDKSTNTQWIRGVDVQLTLVYLDEKAKDKRSPESMVVLKNKARLFAIKVGTKTNVMFYIPPEAYNVYRLSKDPFAYSIELTVNGSAIELSKENIKSLLSKSIVKASDPKKVYDSYQKLVSAAAAANENALMNLQQAPYNVQKFEYENSKDVPTYLPVSK